MKIAMIGQKGIAVGAGGVEKHVEKLSLGLIENGHDVTVYYRNTFIKGNLHSYKGIQLKKIRTINSKSLDAIIYTFKATINALIEGFDVYHYHALGPASLSFIPKMFGKKVIVTVHGLDWQRDKWGKFARCYLKFGEYITGVISDEVISVSNNIKEYFINKYKKRNYNNTYFIPNAVEILTNKESKLIEKYGLENNNYILFLARLVPEKGAHYLIEAYNRLEIDKKLVIAGGSSFTDDYVKKLEVMKGNNDNIIFTGNVQGRLLEELYSNCCIYILPSDIEGMPLTLLEALSYGKYCITSDIKENVDVLKSTYLGTTFLTSNVDDLKNKLQDAINNKLYVENNELRIKYINKNYNWEKVIKETMLIYDK